MIRMVMSNFVDNHSKSSKSSRGNPLCGATVEYLKLYSFGQKQIFNTDREICIHRHRKIYVGVQSCTLPNRDSNPEPLGWDSTPKPARLRRYYQRAVVFDPVSFFPMYWRASLPDA